MMNSALTSMETQSTNPQLPNTQLPNTQSPDTQDQNKTKKCNKCHLIFPIDEFYKRKDYKGTYTWRLSYCRQCLKNTKNQNYAKNKNHYRKYYRDFQRSDPCKLRLRKNYYLKLSQQRQILYLQKLKKRSTEFYDKFIQFIEDLQIKPKDPDTQPNST